MRTFLISALVVAIFIVVVAIGLLIFGHWIPGRDGESPSQDGERALVEELMSESKSYRDARELFSQGNQPDGVAQLERLLQDPDLSEYERTHIEFLKASALSRYDALAAIPLLKEIAADTENAMRQRAYAVQHLGLIYMMGLGDKEEVTTVIFSDDPYRSFFDENDVMGSYMSLFEYANSFQPLMVASSYLAWSTAGQLEEGPSDQFTDVQVRAMEESIFTNLARAESEMADAALHNEMNYVPRVLALKAAVYARLQSAGVEGVEGDYREVFDQALESAMVQGSYEEDVRLAYAKYLLELEGEAAVNKVRSLLRPLIATIEVKEGMRTYFINARGGRSETTQMLQRFASVDPDFRNMLISLGWSEADLQVQ